MSSSIPQVPARSGRSGTAPDLARLSGTACALALFTAAMWFAWLGWDHEYYFVDGVALGPYRAWQVVGCGLSITTATVVAYLWTSGRAAILVLAGAAAPACLSFCC